VQPVSRFSVCVCVWYHLLPVASAVSSIQQLGFPSLPPIRATDAGSTMGNAGGPSIDCCCCWAAGRCHIYGLNALSNGLRRHGVAKPGCTHSLTLPASNDFQQCVVWGREACGTAAVSTFPASIHVTPDAIRCSVQCDTLLVTVA